MTRPIVNEFNMETQETVVREMNDAEYEIHLSDLADQESKAAAQSELDAQQAAKAAAKAELLAALNLSQETLDILNGLN
jgi:hypothetical protein